MKFLKKFLVLACVAMLSCVAHGQVFPRNAAQGDVIVLTTLTFPKGKGCVWVTGQTKFPLSRDECNRVAEENNQPFYVDHKNPMMQIIGDGIFFNGQIMAYIFTKGGNGWVAVDPN